MKPEKLVTMYCPSCKRSFGEEPIIILQQDGGSRLEHRLMRKCRICGGGLVRKVTETKLTFKVGKENAKPTQNVKRYLAEAAVPKPL